MTIYIQTRNSYPSELNNNGIRLGYFLDDEEKQDNGITDEDLMGQTPVFTIIHCNICEPSDNDVESWLNIEQAKILHKSLELFINKYDK